jgi:hypothetical protein
MTAPWDSGPEVNDHTVKLVNGAFVPKRPLLTAVSSCAPCFKQLSRLTATALATAPTPPSSDALEILNAAAPLLIDIPPHAGLDAVHTN